MLRTHYVVGFAGHRSGIDEGKVAVALSGVLDDLANRAGAAGGVIDICGGAAAGADVLCLEIAASKNIPVHIVLPLPEDEFMEDFGDARAWERSAVQISRARKRPGVDSVAVVPGEVSRPDCYSNQAAYMLEAIDLLIAVWDGEQGRGTGGTADVVDKARLLEIPVIHIDFQQAVVSLPEGLGQTFQPDPLIESLKRIEAVGGAGSEPAMDPDRLQYRLDTAAVREAGRFRPTLVGIILLHGIAALLAAAVTFTVAEKWHWWEQGKWIVTAVELVLVSAALLLGVRLYRKHTQETWIKCRFACELVRGLRFSVPLVDPLNPLVSIHSPEWRRFAVSAGLLVQAHRTTFDPMTLRDAYVSGRLGDEHAESQVVHYQEKQPEATMWWELTGKIGVWSARLAPLFVLLSLMNKASKLHSEQAAWHLEARWLGWVAVGFLPIALPLMAGIAGGVRQALDAGRRKQRYPQMVKRLRDARSRLATLDTESSIRRAVCRSEEMLLDELVEWRLVAEITGEH